MNYTPITIDQVPDLPQDPSLPAGFDSLPYGPGALAAFLGIESVRAFALSYKWPNSSWKKSARGFAANLRYQWSSAATLRQFGNILSDDQKNSINYSCNAANGYTFGALTLFPEAYVLPVGQRIPTVAKDVYGKDSGSFPANFEQGSGYSGATQPGKELTPEMCKQAALDQLNYDVSHGSYLLGTAVA
jgi:hypothetical protein